MSGTSLALPPLRWTLSSVFFLTHDVHCRSANKRLNYLEYLAILHNFDDAARDKVKQEFKAMGATSDLVTFDQYLTAKVYVGDKARMEKDKKNPRSVYTHELSLLKSVDNGDGKLAPEEYFVYHNNYVKQM